MESFWGGVLDVNGAEVMPIFGDIARALEAATAEVSRQPSREEKESVEKVIRLAKDLKEAIEQSPLPRDWGKWATLTSNADNLVVAVGWRDMRTDGYGVGHSIEIVKVLDWAVDLAEAHIFALPPRSIVRHRDRADVSAFVRWLAWLFGVKLGKELRSEIALVASAVFEKKHPTMSLTKRDIDNILKDRPQEFVPPLKGRRRAAR